MLYVYCFGQIECGDESDTRTRERVVFLSTCMIRLHATTIEMNNSLEHITGDLSSFYAS